MKQLTINGIKNKSNDWNMLLTDAEKQYIAEFMEKHKEEFLTSHFDIFLDFDFLVHMLSDVRISFFNMLLDLSEKDTVINLNKKLAEVDEDVKRILDGSGSTIKEVIVE